MGPKGLAWFRRRERALSQGVLALFCLVWLQAALLPCAMAALPEGLSVVAEEHCPYCPPAHATEAQDDDAPTVCAYPDGPQVDTRGTLAAAAAPTPAPLPLLLIPHDGLAQPLLPDDTDSLRPRTSFAVTYCRFLE